MHVEPVYHTMQSCLAQLVRSVRCSCVADTAAQLPAATFIAAAAAALHKGYICALAKAAIGSSSGSPKTCNTSQPGLWQKIFVWCAGLEPCPSPQGLWLQRLIAAAPCSLLLLCCCCAARVDAVVAAQRLPVNRQSSMGEGRMKEEQASHCGRSVIAATLAAGAAAARELIEHCTAFISEHLMCVGPARY